MKKILYEAPVAEQIQVRFESACLTNSVQVSRQSYGAAVEETWDE